MMSMTDVATNGAGKTGAQTSLPAAIDTITEKVDAALNAYKPIHLRAVDDGHPVCDYAKQTADAYRKKADEVVEEAEKSRKVSTLMQNRLRRTPRTPQIRSTTG